MSLIDPGPHRCSCGTWQPDPPDPSECCGQPDDVDDNVENNDDD